MRKQLTEEEVPAREDLWAEEERLNTQERRKRYKCRSYVTISEVPTWSEYLTKLRNCRTEGGKEKEKKEETNEAEDNEKAEDPKKAKREEREKKKRAVEEVDRELELQDTNAVYPPDEELNDKVSLWGGDITRLELDAVVNAAKRTLLGGGGIDGAIHRAAGKKLLYECVRLDGCATGECKLTRGYNLPAKFILHTVGPIGERPKKLRQCYTNCLETAKNNDIRTLAFCGISTGIYGYPLYRATRIALDTVRKWLQTGENSKAIDRIVFCVFLEKEKDCYELLMPKFFPLSGDSFVAISAEEEESMLKREEEFEKGRDPEDDEAIKTTLATKGSNVMMYVGLVALVVLGAYVLLSKYSTLLNNSTRG